MDTPTDVEICDYIINVLYEKERRRIEKNKDRFSINGTDIVRTLRMSKDMTDHVCDILDDVMATMVKGIYTTVPIYPIEYIINCIDNIIKND